MKTKILTLALCSAALANANAQEWKSLFNGKDLTGWDGNPKFWRVEDGAITGQTTQDNPTRGNTFLVYRADSVDDFELKLQYKMIGGNSGIQYRSEDLGNWVIKGYQADMEAGDTYSGIQYEEKGRGIMAQRGQVTIIHADSEDASKHKVEVVGSLGDTKVINTVIKKEDWNDYRIIANGNTFIHMINGRVTAVVVDEHEAGSRKSGLLALQLHAGPPMNIQFRNIEIRPIR